VTIHSGDSVTAPTLATVQVDNLGAWQFRQSGSSVAPDPGRRLTLESSSGGELTNVTVTVRN